MQNALLSINDKPQTCSGCGDLNEAREAIVGFLSQIEGRNVQRNSPAISVTSNLGSQYSEGSVLGLLCVLLDVLFSS